MIYDFSRMKRRLWMGTLMLHVFLVILVAFNWPQYLQHAFFGVAMGLFYLWSLLFNAEHPKRGVQFVFSLIRIVIFAYLIVRVAAGGLAEFAIVICGLLSYKVVLTADALVYVAAGLHRQAKAQRAKAQNRSDSASSSISPVSD